MFDNSASQTYLHSSWPSNNRSFSRTCNKLHSADLAIAEPIESGWYSFQSFCNQFNLVGLQLQNASDASLGPYKDNVP